MIGPAAGRRTRSNRVCLDGARAKARALVLVAIATAACGPPPLANTFPSSDALARAVLDAVERRDEPALRNLGLSEHEFRAHVWPSLPAARPERNLPFTYVWGDLKQKSDASLAVTLDGHGGRHYELNAVKFAAPPTDYAAFRVHRDPTFVVRDETTETREARLTGSLIEKDGRWKVFSYVIDD